MGTFEEKYNDTLRSIELAIVRVYRTDNLVDFQTLTAVNNLIRHYTAVARRRTLPNFKMDPVTQRVFDDVKVVCEGWLGNAPVFDESGQMGEVKENAHQVSEIVLCLKRIRKSIGMWRKEGGRTGYYDFINQFLPD